MLPRTFITLFQDMDTKGKNSESTARHSEDFI